MIPMTPNQDWTGEIVRQLQTWRQWFEGALLQAPGAPQAPRPPVPSVPDLISPNRLPSRARPDGRPGGDEWPGEDVDEPDDEYGSLEDVPPEHEESSFIFSRKSPLTHSAADLEPLHQPLTTVRAVAPALPAAVIPEGPTVRAAPRSLYRVAQPRFGRGDRDDDTAGGTFPTARPIRPVPRPLPRPMRPATRPPGANRPAPYPQPRPQRPVVERPVFDIGSQSIADPTTEPTVFGIGRPTIDLQGDDARDDKESS